jgi:hypothetical protein
MTSSASPTTMPPLMELAPSTSTTGLNGQPPTLPQPATFSPPGFPTSELTPPSQTALATSTFNPPQLSPAQPSPTLLLAEPLAHKTLAPLETSLLQTSGVTKLFPCSKPPSAAPGPHKPPLPGLVSTLPFQGASPLIQSSRLATR